MPSSSITSGMSRGFHLLVAGARHLERRRQVRPQLESVHAARRVALRHLLMDDAAARRHPLDVAGGEPAVAHAVAVFDAAGEHVGDGLDAAVRMPGKPGQVVVRDIVAEVVEEQERDRSRTFAEAERAAQMDAGALQRRLEL